MCSALLADARNRAAVMAILHDLNLAVRFAIRIVVIHRGLVTADGLPERTITDDMIRKVFEVMPSFNITATAVSFCCRRP